MSYCYLLCGKQNKYYLFGSLILRLCQSPLVAFLKFRFRSREAETDKSDIGGLGVFALLVFIYNREAWIVLSVQCIVSDSSIPLSCAALASSWIGMLELLKASYGMCLFSARQKHSFLKENRR